MLGAFLGGADLLSVDFDISFQTAPDHAGIIDPVSGFFRLLFQRFQPRLRRRIVFLDLFKFTGSRREFGRSILQLSAGFGQKLLVLSVLQKENVRVQMPELFHGL